MNDFLQENAVELLIADFKKRYKSGYIEYGDPKGRWRQAVDLEFPKHNPKSYGVYIIRHRETRTILYLGKAGKQNDEGQFQNQDLPLRLKNTRKTKVGEITANRWFKDLLEEEGPIMVEYIVLNSTKDTPILIEKNLMDCHRQVFGCDPKYNRNSPR